ncbi:MAG: hypothetical protein HDR74_09855 [Bacteroides sp.]|nr:hypothetical protein [Bacteroides sp.]
MGLLDDLKKTVIDSVSDLPATIINQKKEIVKETSVSSEIQKAPHENDNILVRIGCSPKTIEFVCMSLADGILDNKEKELLIRRATEDGVDLQEFDFVITKALEAYHTACKRTIEELSNFFNQAEAMSKKEQKPNEATLSSAVPAIMDVAGKSKGNPYLIAGLVAGEVVGQAITSFIKEPSKLNTFKAEIIRKIDIPLFPEVLVDFFGYASSQIIEEKQRNNGKGIFTEWSETLFGKDIDLVPIWKEKMTQVMTKTVMKYGHDPNVMSLVAKWRETPLKKLSKITDPNEIENFPIPNTASDYIELVKYSFEKAEDVKVANREVFAHLNSRLMKEAKKFINFSPIVKDVIEECRIKPVSLLMSYCDDSAFMVQFEVPDKLSDLLEVLNFLQNRKDLKKHYQRLYDEAIVKFGSDLDAIKKIKQFKPKNIFGL